MTHNKINIHTFSAAAPDAALITINAAEANSSFIVDILCSTRIFMATNEVGKRFESFSINAMDLRRVVSTVVAKYTRGHSKMPWCGGDLLIAWKDSSTKRRCLVDYNILEDGIDICCCNGGLWQ